MPKYILRVSYNYSTEVEAESYMSAVHRLHETSDEEVMTDWNHDDDSTDVQKLEG
jgi:hypothetical protein